MNNNHPISVENKVVLVTGATGLIGKEVSFMLLKNGAKVVFADLQVSERSRKEFSHKIREDGQHECDENRKNKPENTEQ